MLDSIMRQEFRGASSSGAGAEPIVLTLMGTTLKGTILSYTKGKAKIVTLPYFGKLGPTFCIC